MVQLMPLPLTVSCFSKVQIGCVMCVLVFWYDIILLAQQCWTDYSLNSISAFNLLVGWQEGHHTHTHPFNGPFSGTTRVSRYHKGKTRKGIRPVKFLRHFLPSSSVHVCSCVCLSAEGSSVGGEG